MADYEQIMSALRAAHAAGDTAAATRLAQMAQEAKAKPVGPPVIAETSDGGKIYRMEDGSLSFSSPGMSTNNQDTIAKLMQGATPAEASTYGNVSEGGQLGTAMRSGVQGMTFGGGDELVAGVTSAFGPNSYETELQRERARLDKGRDNNPGTALTAEIGGALAVPLGGMKSTGKIGLDALRSGTIGGALSGIYGFLSGEGGAENRMDNAMDSAKWGAGIGAAIPAVGGVAQRIMEGIAKNKAISAAAQNAPSTEELRRMGNAAYRAVDDAGVQISPQAFDRTRGTILDDLRANTGFDELPGPGSLTPNSARVNEIMGQASTKMAADPTAALPFSSLDQMRRQAGAAAGNVANKTDQRAGMSIISGLDDMVNNLTPGDVVAGDVAALQSALPKARETWSRMSKSQMIDDAIEAGGDYLSGASSGIRNQFKNILRNPKTARSFTDAEKEAMRRVVNGSIPEQLLNLAGGGLGQMATAIGGGAMAGIPGLLLGSAAAAGTRKLAEKVTSGKAETLRAMIANGGMQSLPQISSGPREVIERLMRQGSAASLQQ